MSVNGDETNLKYERAACDSEGLPEETGYRD